MNYLNNTKCLDQLTFRQSISKLAKDKFAKIMWIQELKYFKLVLK